MSTNDNVPVITIQGDIDDPHFGATTNDIVAMASEAIMEPATKLARLAEKLGVERHERICRKGVFLSYGQCSYDLVELFTAFCDYIDRKTGGEG